MSNETSQDQDTFWGRCDNSEQSMFGKDSVFTCAQPHWREDNTCSHCGGIRPSIALAAIKAGAEVEPTDKNYKMYVCIPDLKKGQMYVVSVMNWTPKDYNPEDRGYVKADPEILKRDGWSGTNAHWMQLVAHGDTERVKCYFNHFSEAQAVELILLDMMHKINFALPGHFYSGLCFGMYKDAISRALDENKAAIATAVEEYNKKKTAEGVSS